MIVDDAAPAITDAKRSCDGRVRIPRASSRRIVSGADDLASQAGYRDRNVCATVSMGLQMQMDNG